MPSLFELLALRDQAGNDALKEATRGLEPERASYKGDIELPVSDQFADPLSGNPLEWVRPGPNVGMKGSGFLGLLRMPDGRTMSENSIAESDKLKQQGPPPIGLPDDRYINYPSVVPTLSEQEIKRLLSGEPASPSIIIKATRFAEDRMRQGKPPFALPGETNEGLFPELMRRQYYLRPSHR